MIDLKGLLIGTNTKWFLIMQKNLLKMVQAISENSLMLAIKELKDYL